MNRRQPELLLGDWVDVFCTVCHRRIMDSEWYNEDAEYGTVCGECYNRAALSEDEYPGRSGRRGRYRRSRRSLPI